MRPYERLAVLTALEKAVKDAIRGTRAECNDMALESYEDDGVEKRALKVNGQKVGEFIVTFNAEGFEVTDREAFNDFALDYGFATVRRTIAPDMMESAIRALEGVFDPDVMEQAVVETVELHPDWEKALENVGGVVQYMDSGLNVPGVRVKPKSVKGTMVRGCKPADVLPMAAQIEGGMDALLLGDGK